MRNDRRQFLWRRSTTQHQTGRGAVGKYRTIREKAGVRNADHIGLRLTERGNISDGQPVALRQHDIEHDDIERLFAQKFKGIVCIVAKGHIGTKSRYMPFPQCTKI